MGDRREEVPAEPGEERRDGGDDEGQEADHDEAARVVGALLLQIN